MTDLSWCERHLLCGSIFRALWLQRMCQATEAGGGCWPLTTFLWMLQSETTYQSPSAQSVPTREMCSPRIPPHPKGLSSRTRHRPWLSVKFSTGVFYMSCIWWQVRRCPVPTLILSSFGKHSLTGQPLTHCLDLYSFSTATALQTQLVSYPL